jgi:PAS domain S-box-containing protein
MQSSTPAGSTTPSFLLGGGEMGARMRERDWSTTPLGPAEHWPRSLKTAVRIMLTSRQPMFVWWGPELINLYNDAYKAIVGGKHPEALGQPASEVWREIWDQVGPRAESVTLENEGTYDESLLLIMERNGYPEETYYTFSYSPVPDDEGGTGGILCANTEDTQSIIGERQLALLRELAFRTADARTFDQACSLSTSCLGTNPHDLPFALIYLIDPEKRRVSLAGTCGIGRNHPAVPETVELDGDSIWPFAEVIRTHRACLAPTLGAAFGDLPAGAWQRPPHQAVAVPIAPSGEKGKAGVLIAGLSPFRLFDDNYRGFVDLVSAQIAASIANAQAYEEERKRSEALAELDRAKTAFFSNVSHEFRTPLTLMLGPLDDLLARPEEKVGRENREILSLAYRNGQRLLKLVNTLLDFSRIEAGRVQAVYEPLDLAAYTAELASVFRAAVEKAGLRLDIDCPPLPEPVFVDRDLWEKIVLNLVSNAFKYTLEGEIRVMLRADMETGSAVLAVEDTGTGIPEAELPNVFNRFHRVQETRGRTHEGTGIGLALVLELVKLHGGTVRVDSVFGAGTTFTVTVPFGREHLPADRIGGARTLAATNLGASPFVEEALRWLPGTVSRDTGAFSIQTGLLQAGRPASPGNRPKVVLADDNADMRDYVRRLLSTDYEVVAVADGAEALRVTAAQRPDLVLTDVMMPNLDGFGLLRALREDPRTAPIPVIMLSARAGEEARVEGLEAGADEYLTKPFSARELLARVGGTLALARVRREAMRREEELKAETTSVLESITEAFLALDRDFRFTYVNAEAERINGMPRAEILGKTFWEVFPAALGTHLETEFHRTMTERIPVKFENFYQPWERWFEVDVYPTKTEGLAVYYRDITDRKRTLEALQEADRRKDEFLATLAHELRNPLAPIRNGLQVLRLAKDQPRVEEQARGMIERQVQQMVRLIDDLLDLSRISRGKFELRRERVALAMVLQNAMETSRPLIEQSGHELTLSLPPEPVFVDADVTRLAQVFANLLNNAAKYTERGGEIRLAVEPRDGEVVVRVRDTGVGIPAAMLPQVFEMFTQVDRSLERSQGGLGIGLSIVKRLVEMHGGTVEARSEGHGRGTELVVRLPVLAPAAEAPRPLGDGEEPAAAPVRRRVLVTDDNEDSAASLAMMLEFMGNEVRTAHDGVEAVETAAAFRPDVILLDIGMPRMNGYDACREIRQQPWSGGIAIVALTGWGQDEDKRRSREAGFDHHLVKPVEPVALERLLAGLQAGAV